MAKPKVMILGTFHFGETTDLKHVEYDNISSVKRREEIKMVVESIKKFRPTKLAFEVVKEKNNSLNNDFRNYLDGKFELGVNEVHQIGFKVAEELGHREIFAVDWRDNVGQRGYGEVMDWAKNETPEILDYISKIEQSMNLTTELVNDSFFETIKKINEENIIKKLHEINMNIGRIGIGTNYVGIDWLKWWYQRNLIIYSNLTNLISSQNDRISLLIGGNHTYLVSQFLQESGLVEIEPANSYLK
jgi:hypothetical protein